MATRKTRPQLFEECRKIELSYLWKRYAMWSPQRTCATLSWSCRGEPRGSINPLIDTRGMYLELDCRYDDSRSSADLSYRNRLSYLLQYGR